ncbi:MAG: hypothetical protein JWO80_498 [Bryobacterales bacterium]|nr:hypothetical protein [Bryobacterales bacterium]
MRLIAALALTGLLHAGTLDVLKRGPKTKYFVYVATNGGGIASYRFDPEEGTLEPLATATAVPKPAWLSAHPSNQLLYAVSDDSVASFAVNGKTGALRLMNTASSRGTGGCHITMDKNGWMLLVTNCTSGNVASFRTEGDGGVGPSMGLQETGHAGEAVISPDNFFIFVPDSTGKVFHYRFNASEATFWPNAPPSFALAAGAGAGHIAFRPDLKFAYSVDEKKSSVSVLRYNREAGTVTELVASVSTPPGTAEIAVDAAGRFAYESSRSDASLAVYAIDRKAGTLKQVQRVPSGGRGPGTFRIDPSGGYLLVANQSSNSIALFKIERKTGMVTPAGKALTVPSPVCIEFIPARPE